MLIITSDHGEELGEHQLIGHGLCLYDTVLRVPLIIRYPKIFRKGLRVKNQVQLLDIFPTILHILGIAEYAENIDGQSLLEDSQRDYTIAEHIGFFHNLNRIKQSFPDLNHDALDKYDRGLKAIRTVEYKFIEVSNGQNELYNLSSDPNELNNIIDQEEEIANDLESRLKAWKDSFESEEIDTETTIDEKIRKRLRGLGYIE